MLTKDYQMKRGLTFLIVLFLYTFACAADTAQTVQPAQPQPAVKESPKVNPFVESEAIIPLAMFSSLVSPGLGLMETGHMMSGLTWTVIDAVIVSQLIFNKEVSQNSTVGPMFLGIAIVGRLVAVPVSVITAGQYIDKFKKISLDGDFHHITLTYTINF